MSVNTDSIFDYHSISQYGNYGRGLPRVGDLFFPTQQQYQMLILKFSVEFYKIEGNLDQAIRTLISEHAQSELLQAAHVMEGKESLDPQYRTFLIEDLKKLIAEDPEIYDLLPDTLKKNSTLKEVYERAPIIRLKFNKKFIQKDNLEDIYGSLVDINLFKKSKNPMPTFLEKSIFVHKDGRSLLQSAVLFFQAQQAQQQAQTSTELVPYNTERRVQLFHPKQAQTSTELVPYNSERRVQLLHPTAPFQVTPKADRSSEKSSGRDYIPESLVKQIDKLKAEELAKELIKVRDYIPLIEQRNKLKVEELLEECKAILSKYQSKPAPAAAAAPAPASSEDKDEFADWTDLGKEAVSHPQPDADDDWDIDT